MDAFIAGRAAVTNKNLANRDIAITNVRLAMEKLAAANAIHYINATMAAMDDVCIKGHMLAEAYGFAYALKFNTDKTIEASDLTDVLANLGGSGLLADLDFYSIDESKLNNAKNKLSSTYGLDDIKDSL
jgi:enhancing lycopene biosynthesis protein 2